MSNANPHKHDEARWNEVRKAELRLLLAVKDGDCHDWGASLLRHDEHDHHFAAEVAHQLAHDLHGMVVSGDVALGDATPDNPSAQFEKALLEELAWLESQPTG